MQVSVIVPIYNAEKYLKRTLEQLASQTFMKVEFLLVDDGSSDKSREILLEWKAQRQDSRFKFFFQQNGGVSVARNKGIAEATADYVIFVDGDDVFSENFVESYYNSIVNDMSDISFFSAGKLTETGENIGTMSYQSLAGESFYNVKELLVLFGQQKLLGYSFMFISKRSLWNENSFDKNIKFQEDVEALARVMLNNPSMQAKFHSEVFYYYVQNSKSALHNMTTEGYKQFIEVSEKVVSYAERLNLGTDVQFVRGLMLANLNIMINAAALDHDVAAFGWARQMFLENFSKTKLVGPVKLRRYMQYVLIKFKMIKVIKFIYQRVLEN